MRSGKRRRRPSASHSWSPSVRSLHGCRMTSSRASTSTESVSCGSSSRSSSASHATRSESGGWNTPLPEMRRMTGPSRKTKLTWSCWHSRRRPMSKASSTPSLRCASSTSRRWCSVQRRNLASDSAFATRPTQRSPVLRRGSSRVRQGKQGPWRCRPTRALATGATPTTRPRPCPCWQRSTASLGTALHTPDSDSGQRKLRHPQQACRWHRRC
mmetsp:Transcript_55196/g.118648  ORF Transcript_55196/g.118648 Transcript_55196/m.118648 type:complete len:213 (+) Transcript_55196:882-1520(+)